MNKFISDLNKKYPESEISLGNSIKTVECVSTGSLSLDYSLGGGFPKGRIVEVVGESGFLKTTLSFLAVKEAQKRGEQVLFIDAECSVNLKHIQAYGVDTSKLIIVRPDSGENGLRILEDAVDTGEFGLIVVDSVAALVPMAEVEEEVGKAHMGKHAKMMNQSCKKIVYKLMKTGTIVLFINQVRESMDAYTPFTTPGGKAIGFFSSQRIQMLKPERQKENHRIKMRWKVFKNKVVGNIETGEVMVDFNKGYEMVNDIVNVGVELGVIGRKGAYYDWDGKTYLGKAGLEEMGDDKIEKLRGEITKAINKTQTISSGKTEKK